MATDNMLQECLLKTREVSVQWKELGVLLNIKKYLLDQIERNYPRDVATCRMEMLHAWLKSNPVNPEAVLGDALKDILKTTYDSKNNQKAECMRLDGTIEEQIEDLKADFANIVTDTQVCLEDRYSNPKYARSWLNEILRGTKDEPLVIEESASDYFLQLQNKWSFTNPTLLQQLADKLKNALLKGKMQDYKRKFDEFCHSFPINNETAAKPVEFELCDPRQPCLVLIFESVSKFYDIEVFLTDVFDIYKRYLRVHKIELGSIQTVTVQFAASMEPHFQACIDQNRETARRHNVTDMHIEPQTGLKPTAPDTTATEDQTHEAVDTLDGKIQNMTRTPETRSRKRAYSAPNGTNKKNKASKLANGEMTPA